MLKLCEDCDAPIRGPWRLSVCASCAPLGDTLYHCELQDDVETVRVLCPVQDYAPRFDRVIPPITTGEPSGTVLFDPSYLLDAATAFRALGVKHVRVQSGAPMRIDGDGYIFDLHCTAVIMPMES